MKLYHLLASATLGIAAFLTTAYAEDTTSEPNSSEPAPAPGPTAGPTPGPTSKAPANAPPVTPGESPLDDLKAKDNKFEYQMPYVRVVHSRAQGDKPEFSKDRFISKFGRGDFERGYVGLMDTVNTASVEGALMFVQAEGIDELSRGADKRCERKNDMKYIVFYEILIAQSNETIAQYRDRKWGVPEYGQMQPMDGGRCTPERGENFPAECLQYNGDKGQPNLGPNVGGGLKNNNDRAPYPDTYWFSFPHTCPLKERGEKEDLDSECRKNTRKGLCDLGKAPDGVECTFTYDVLGWVPIDDVVGITDLTDDNGNAYNFTTWCKASKENVEFQRGPDLDKIKGLPFWDNPLDVKANIKRAEKVITLYDDIITGAFTSTMISAKDRSHFKPLPKPEALEAINPPCYKTVPECNEGNGCQRLGFSQICTACKSPSDKCKTDPTFKFPALAKAPTELPEEQTTSVPNPELGANGRVDGTQKTEAPSGAATLATVQVVTLALAVASVMSL